MVSEIVAGVAGAGVFGGYHAQKYALLPGVRLGAIFDIDLKRAEALARAHGAIPHPDFETFLAQVQVVTIATPASFHYQLAAQALEAGRHVLIEKPIALRLDEADRLIDLAESRGLTIQVGHQERFVFESFGIPSRGAKPHFITCRRSNPPTGRGEDVSVVLDLMIHDLDLVRCLNLGPVESISAAGDSDEAQARITFAGGTSAVFEASRRAHSRDRRMSMTYGSGVVEIDFVKRTIANTTATPLAASFEAAGPAIIDPLGHGVAQFLAAVQEKKPPIVTARAGRAALEWAIEIDRVMKPAHESPRVRAQA